MKKCTQCGKKKNFSRFYAGVRGTLESWCKKCKDAYVRDWTKKHPERRKLYQRKWFKANRDLIEQHRKERKFGMSNAQYISMIKMQSGKCAICKKSNLSLGVDHNHKTGKVRGLLCDACNLGLGLFKDNSNLVHKAILYLVKNS